MKKRSVVGFVREMAGFHAWISDPSAKTQLFSISGIGGIGKTTLLTEMAGLARSSSILTLWLDGRSELASSGVFLSSLEMGLASEYGRHRLPETPQLPYIIGELSRQRTVLLLDHCEQMAALEGWLLSSFLPQLASAQVLIVLASRNGLPVKWRTNPYWSERIRSYPLQLFTREEMYEYLRGSGLPEEVQKQIAQKNEGHPLLLALTVDLLRRQAGEERGSSCEIPAILSAEFLREAASPSLYQAFTVLSLLPAAGQPTLNRLLDVPLAASDYYALGQLSCVRTTPQGLALHRVVARLLREDWAKRDPAQFQGLRTRVFGLLAEQFDEADGRGQMRIAAHVLELYREFLPAGHAYADFSSRPSFGETRPYQPEDLPHLHRHLATSVSRANWQCELVRPEEYHSLLDDIAAHCPSGIFIVCDGDGTPLAFCAGLWLHAGTLPLIERYARALLPLLGSEADELRGRPPEAADSIFVPLAAVNEEQALYDPEELGALLLQQWMVSMTMGLRGMMVTGDRHLNQLLPYLGFQARGTVRAGEAGNAELMRWELDFRQTAFSEWVQTIIRQTGSAPASHALPSAPPAIRPEAPIAWHDAKQMLEQLFQPVLLEQLPIVRELKLQGLAIQRHIAGILTAAEPPYPLTRLEQRMLRETYLHKDRNKNQLAEAFHMSRTTFYRQSRLAMTHLAHVLAQSLGSDERRETS